MNPGIEQQVEHAAALIEQADALIVAAGAGMGVDSGMPDFRGRDGFWKAYPALGRAGLHFTDVANPKSFVASPDRAWGFYGHRLAMYREKQPHAGFELLRKWGDGMLHGSAVFTSNVDGHFQRAGFDPGLIHECHGSIHHLQCSTPCSTHIWSCDDFVPEIDADNCSLLNPPPVCPICKGMARPNILMFGDWAWVEDRARRQEQALNTWLRRTTRPVVIEIGAGSAIPSVRHFSHRVLTEHGGRLIRINPTEADVPSSLDVGLPLGGLSGLLAISAALNGN